LVISYELSDSLYINLTNRCSNRCTFCLRTHKGEAKDMTDWVTSEDISGSGMLWLDHEPTVSEIIDDLKKRDLKKYKEVVFCGFGEPFMRFYDCVEVAKWLKEQNITVRVNTNGHANLIFGKDVTDDMVGLFDTVSISLNQSDADKYDEICKSDFGKDSYSALIEFGKLCKAKGMDTVFTIVDVLPKEDIEKCKQIAENCGIRLRIRSLIKEN